MVAIRLVTLSVVFCFAAGAMFAKTPALDSASGRKVDLTVAQRKILYQRITTAEEQ
jgi:hypothetical protein